jgi:hypothetical protein
MTYKIQEVTPSSSKEKLGEGEVSDYYHKEFFIIPEFLRHCLLLLRDDV